MKEQILYTCDHCGISYKDKKECQKCEEGHKIPVAIVSAKHIAIRSNPTGYPTQVTVRFEDGSERTYKQ